LGEAQHVVLRESKQLIEQVKDLVVEYVTKKGELSLLGEAAELMMNLRGTLIMVPQIEAADISRICSNILQNHVHRQERPKDVLLDALAEALSGIEYFIERLEETNADDHQGVLSKARTAILPFMPAGDVAEKDGILADEVLEDDLIEVDIVTTALDDEHYPDHDDVPAVSQEQASAQQLNAQLSDTLEGLSELPEIEVEDEVLAEAIVEAMDESPLELELPSEPQITAPVVTEDLDDDDDLIDDEIIEIFLEEAQEVLETIEEFWPVFKSNNQDDEALANTRRAFHTLKGSGRMVGAQEIGETAWAIENMFNRLLDNSIDMSPSFVDIVDFMVEQIPALITAFEQRRACDVDILSIQEYAENIAKGNPVGPWQSTEHQAEQQNEEQIEQEVVLDLPELDDAKDDLLESALLEVFSSEVEGHIKVVEDFIVRKLKDTLKL